MPLHKASWLVFNIAFFTTLDINSAKTEENYSSLIYSKRPHQKIAVKKEA